MARPNYIFLQPESLPEALHVLSEHGDEAKVLAGGTALVLLLKQGLITPTALLNISQVPNLNYIQLRPNGIHVGPLTTLRDIERSSIVQDNLPLLAHACGEVGNVRVRNQATLGGNIAEADYASDPPTALLALEAQITARSSNGSRTIPLEEFLLGFYSTCLEPVELITDIHIPLYNENSKTTYRKFKSRSSEDRPCAGVAAIASFDNGICTDLRLSVGAACEVPRRLRDAERLALHQVWTHDLILEIANTYADGIETLDDARGSAWYRTEMIRVQVQRALEVIRNDNR